MYLIFILTCLILLCSIIIFLYHKRILVRNQYATRIGFFHPFSESGGGGEKVLWSMIQAFQKTYPAMSITLYKGSTSLKTPKDLAELVKTQFDLNIEPTFQICLLRGVDIINPKYHPFASLIFQNLASCLLGIQVIFSNILPPSILFDTSGHPFCYGFFKFVGVTVVPYVHYPMISYSGIYTDLVLTNSSWTFNHIKKTWRNKKQFILYPPVELEQIIDFCKNVASKNRPQSIEKELLIISVSQFRPEKNHIFQIEIFNELVKRNPHLSVKFALIGSCRNNENRKRVAGLMEVTKELGIDDKVQFVVDAPFSSLLEFYSRALIGLHTMKDEHFGINIVEFMAADVIPVAHNSGGPKEDILKSESKHKLGFLCTSLDEYVKAIETILRMNPSERLSMAEKSRSMVIKKFSSRVFENALINDIFKNQINSLKQMLN